MNAPGVITPKNIRMFGRYNSEIFSEDNFFFVKSIAKWRKVLAINPEVKINS
jgi:hypothetical protein